MNVSAYVISKYEGFCGFGRRKNKAKQSQTKRIENVECRMANPEFLRWCNLKKQSQFGSGANQYKFLYERGLWQQTGLWATKKQSQFKVYPERSRMGQYTSIC